MEQIKCFTRKIYIHTRENRNKKHNNITSTLLISKIFQYNYKFKIKQYNDLALYVVVANHINANKMVQNSLHNMHNEKKIMRRINTPTCNIIVLDFSTKKWLD